MHQSLPRSLRPWAWLALGNLAALGNLGCAPAAGSPSSQDSSTGTGAVASGGAAPAAGGQGAGGQGAGVGGTLASGGASSGTGGTSSGGSSTGGSIGAGGDPNAGSGGVVVTTGGTGPLADVTVFIAGDSTVSNYADTASPSDQAGWGQMLPEIFSHQVTVDNRAAGGRTALWFELEGAVAEILGDIQPGDYFFIQFGTNDGNTTATFTVDGTTYPRFADPETDFKVHLKDYYLDPSRAALAIPVLVTPPPRNSAYCGTGNSLGAYAQAMRELGEAEGVLVLDLNQRTFDHLAAICPAPTPEDFFLVRTDASVDGTHFQENGARHMAAFLSVAIEDVGLGLAPYLLP